MPQQSQKAAVPDYVMDESLVMINIVTLTLWIYYGHFTLQLLFALIVPSYQGPQEFITHVPQALFYLPSVRPGASAVYVRRNLLFFQLRSLLIKESLAFSMFTSSPTQNTSQAAWTCNNKVKGRNTTIQPFPFKVRNGQRPLKRYTE